MWDTAKSKNVEFLILLKIFLPLGYTDWTVYFLDNVFINNEIDLDSLPDTDVYFQKWYIYESYKAYMKFRNKKMK